MVCRRSQVPSAGKVAASLAAVSALVSVFVGAGAHSASQPVGRIAFTRADGIYVIRADGSGVRALRRGGVAARAVDLAWSPDGRKLAFATWDGDGVWVMNADGTRLLRLLDVRPPGTVSSLSWSPDGRRIAYTRLRGRGELWVMDADGSNQHLLVRMSKPRLYARSEIAWSGSGRVAFTPGGYGIFGLYVMNADGTGLHRLIRAGYLVRQPQWSPDGGSIAFTYEGRNTENEEIAVLRPDGEADARLLTHNNVADSDPAWSSDGSRIAFLRGDYDCMYCPVAGLISTELYVMNADGTGAKRLTHNQVGEGSPAWQPVASS